MILVTGATGNVGSELVKALSEMDAPVRALLRGPKDATDMPDGVEHATGDLDQPETLAEGLRGVRAVFLLPGFGDMPGLLDRVRAAGVERVVLLSSLAAASGDPANAISQYMSESEQAVRDSRLAWTFVRSKAFMSNALRWRSQLATGDVVRVPFATVRTAAIDPFDIAAVAAHALITEGHDEQVHVLSGPESLLPADQVEVLGSVLGRELVCEPLSNDEARSEMEASMPTRYVDAFFDFYVDGTLDESTIEPTVERVTGRPPRTFRQWAEGHADAFRR